MTLAREAEDEDEEDSAGDVAVVASRGETDMNLQFTIQQFTTLLLKRVKPRDQKEHTIEEIGRASCRERV